MSDLVLAAIIAAVPPTLIGLFNFLQSRKNTKKIEEVHKSVNSGLSAQLANAKDAGNIQGRKEQTQERKDDKK